MNTRKLLGTAAATGLMAVTLLAGAGSAQAAEPIDSYDAQLAALCGSVGADKDGRAYDDVLKPESNVRSGPSTECGVNWTSGSSNWTVDYHCYRVVGGYHWTYLRLKGTESYGWARGDRLTDSGSNKAC